jgi:hypothetical protein
MLLLRAVQSGDHSQEARANQLANDFLSDAANKSSDRFQVSLVTKQMALQAQHPHERIALANEIEKNARALIAEFPAEPAAYSQLLNAARLADRAKANRIASDLVGMPCSSVVKRAAQTILDQQDMAGRSVAGFQFTTADHAVHRVAEFAGRRIIFCFWATWSKESMAAFPRIKSITLGQDILVDVNLDSDSTIDPGLGAQINPQGLHCTDVRGLAGALAQQLHIDRVPALCVIDSAGILTGVGDLGDLGTLLPPILK